MRILKLLLLSLLPFLVKAQTNVVYLPGSTPDNTVVARNNLFINGTGSLGGPIDTTGSVVGLPLRATRIRPQDSLAYVFNGKTSGRKWELLATASMGVASITVNGGSAQTGAVSLTIPTNNNQLSNGSNYITAAGAPVQSVNGLTGTVVLDGSETKVVGDNVYLQTIGTGTTVTPYLVKWLFHALNADSIGHKFVDMAALTDGYVPAYQLAGNKIVWVPQSGGGGIDSLFGREDSLPSGDRYVNFSGTRSFTLNHIFNGAIVGDSSAFSIGSGVITVHKLDNSASIYSTYKQFTGSSQRGGAKGLWNNGNPYGEVFGSDGGVNENAFRAYKDSVVENLYNSAPYFIHGLLTTADTTNFKPLGMNPTTGEKRRMTFWPGSGGGGGGGTVTTFSAGSLAPLFTTGVSNATTTPALTFTLSNAAAGSILGNNTGSTGPPAYFVPTATTLNTWFGATLLTANQTITLTPNVGGDVTGTASGTTSLTPTFTIGSNKVTYAKIQAASGQALLGAATAGNFQEITLGTNLSITAGVLNAAGGGGGSQTFQQVLTTGSTMLQANTINYAGFQQNHLGGMSAFDSIVIVRAFALLDSTVFFDNSIGSGTGASTTLTRYSTQLTAKYRNFEANYSVSGTTMQVDGLAKIPLIPVYGTNHRWLIIGYLENDIINAGNNATWDTAHCGPIFRQFVDTAIARGWPASRIIIRSPGWISSTNYANATLVRQGQYFAMAQSIATTRSTIFVDIFNPEVYRGASLLMWDQVLHPNDNGHALMATLIYKAAGDSVRTAGQGIASNRLTALRRLAIHGGDTLSYKAQVLGVDSNGVVGTFSTDAVILSTTGHPQAQAANVNLAGYGIFGNPTSLALPASISLYTPGTIQGGTLRITGTPPAGWAGPGGNFSFNGTTLSIFNRNYTGNVDGPISLNQFGTATSQVMVGTAALSGSGAILQVNGGLEAGSVRSTTTWSGARTGTGAEMGGNGTVGYITALNSSGGVNLNIGFGLAPIISVGSNTYTGTTLFQVNGTSYTSGIAGFGNSAPTAGVDINRTVTSPTTGAKGVDLAIGASTYTFSPDQAQVVTASIDQKTYAFAAAHTVTDASSFDIIGAPIAGANATITNGYAFRVKAGKSQFNSAVQIKDGTQAAGTFFGGDVNGNGAWRSIAVADLPATATWPAQSTIGNIFSQDYFTNNSLADVYVNASGGTNSSVTALNGKFITTASAAAYTNYNIWKPTYYTMLAHTQWMAEFRDSIGGNGFALVLRDPTVGLVGYVSTTAGASTINLLNQSGSAYSSTAGPTMVLGHDYRVILTMNDTAASFSCQDITTGGSVLSTPKVFSPGGGQIPRIAQLGFFAFTGTYCVSKLQYSSTDTKNPNVVFIGDSKTREYTPTTFNRRYADQLGALYPNYTLFAATAMKITDILAAKDELGIVNGQKYVIHIGSNDLRPGGGSILSKAMTDLATLVNFVTAGGGQPIIIVAPEDSTVGGQTVGLTTYKNAISSTWPQYYVDVYPSMTTSGDNRLRASMNVGDGIHFNQVGHDTIVAAIIRSGKLTTLDPTRRSELRTDDNTIGRIGDSVYLKFKVLKRLGNMPYWNTDGNLSNSPHQFNGSVAGYNATKPFTPTTGADFTVNGGVSTSGGTGGYYMESRNGTAGAAVYSIYVLSNIFRTYNNTSGKDLDRQDSIGRKLWGIAKTGSALAPSAYGDYFGGDGTAGNAPIKLRAGTLLVTPENGAVEADASHIYFTAGGTRFQLDQQSGGSGVTTVGTFSGSSIANGASIATSTITFGPADATNPGMIKASGTQTLGVVLTVPAPKFTSMTGAGANDSVLTIDPATGQTHWRNGTANIKTVNGLTSSADSIYWGGTLLQNTSIANGGFTLTFSGTGIMSITSPLTFASASAVDANYTVSTERFVRLFTPITAGRTLTLPSASTYAGRMLTVTNYNNTLNSWTVTPTILDGTGSGIPVNLLVNGATYNLYSDGTSWIINGISYAVTASITPGWQSFTTGTTGTVNNNVTNVLFNPASVIATYTLTLPSNPADGQLVKIHFGGTIGGNAAVVTSLTISPNSGQSIIQKAAPTTGLGGDNYTYAYNIALSIWYRE